MANSKIYARNGLTYGGITLKNGTGGGAPALDELPDWPMRFAFSRDRYTYWRTSAAPSNPLNLDFDLGGAVSIGAGGAAMGRVYASPVDGAGLVLYYGTGSVYPPTWTSAATIGLGANDQFVEFTPISARFWRFEFAVQTGGVGLPFSCKPWLVNAGDIHDLGKSASPGSEIIQRRVRRELTTPAGIPYYFEPGQQRGSQQKVIRSLWLNDDGTILAKIRDVAGAIDTRFIFVDYDGSVMETTLPDGAASWQRRFSTPALYDIALELTGHP